MKFSLNSRQPREYLAKADEIWVKYKDRQSIFEIAKNYPDKDIVLDFYGVSNIDITTIKRLHTFCGDKLIFCYSDLDTAIKINDDGSDIRWFMRTRARDIFDLYQISTLKNKPCYIYLSTELFHSLDVVKQYSIPIRAVVNKANESSFKGNLINIVGSWIRPEDLSTYEQYVSMIEFQSENNNQPKGEEIALEREQALFRIYAEDGRWPGKLKTIVPNLNHDATNRLISPNLAKERLNCGLRCLKGGACRKCHRELDMANEELVQNFKEINI